MKLKIILFIFMFAAIFSTIAAWGDEKPAKIFFLNSFPVRLDIYMKNDDNKIFEMNSINVLNMTTIYETYSFGKYAIYFKHSVSDDWYFWRKKDYIPVLVPVEPGNIYCITMEKDGSINYYILNEKDEQGVHIAFMNLCDSVVERMEIGKEWNTGTAAMAIDLGISNITSFVTAKPGSYVLFYKFPDQGYTIGSIADSGEDFYMLPFEDGSYYVYLLFQGDDQKYSLLFDITTPVE